jgi:multiple sugar transport system permease protein
MSVGSLRTPWSRVAAYAAVILVSLAFASPFVYLLSTSLKDEAQLLNQPREFFPAPLHFRNFLTVFERFDVLRYFANTFVVVIGSVAGNVIVSTLAGYALARLQYRGRELVFLLTLACMFMPLFLIIIPRFIVFQRLGMIGTLLPLIVPSALGSPFCIFLMRQYLRGIPMDLNEAARIDGCGELRIYARIIMPLCRAAVATIVIFTTQWRWNEFIEPLIYLPNEKLYTITMGLYMILGQSAEDITIHLVMAFLILSILPILAVFAAAQKQFVEGVSHTGLKA